MAIGMLNDTKVSGGHSSFEVTEAMAYLIKLRDGDMEKTKFIFSKESQQIAQAAITTVEQSMEQYKTTTSGTDKSMYAETLMNYFNVGKDFIITKMQQGVGTESITLAKNIDIK